MNIRLFFFAALSVIASGCTHTVNYKLTENDRWTGPQIDKVIRVMPLTDATTPPTNKVLRIGNAEWRTNYRQGYKNEALAAEVSAMLTRHLTHSGLFKEVICSNEQPCQLELTGTLKDYSAMGRIHSTAEGIQAGTAGFGLIGALIGSAATANMDTEIRTAVKLEDLKLVDTATQTTVWTGSICLSTNFPEHFQAASQMAVFHYADALLKSAVAELIEKVGRQPTEKWPPSTSNK